MGLHRELLKAGIPAELPFGSLFDSVEVKVARALLRAVAYPDRAGEALVYLFDQAKNSDVYVPLTRGLGECITWAVRTRQHGSTNHSSRLL